MKLINLFAVLAALLCTADVTFAMARKKGVKATEVSSSTEERADREETRSNASETSTRHYQTRSVTRELQSSASESASERSRSATQEMSSGDDDSEASSRRSRSSRSGRPSRKATSREVEETSSVAPIAAKKGRKPAKKTTKSAARKTLTTIEEGDEEVDVPVTVPQTVVTTDAPEEPLVPTSQPELNTAAGSSTINESSAMANSAALVPESVATIDPSFAANDIGATPLGNPAVVHDQYVTPETDRPDAITDCTPADHLTPEANRAIMDLPDDEVEDGPIAGRYDMPLPSNNNNGTLESTQSAVPTELDQLNSLSAATTVEPSSQPLAPNVSQTSEVPTLVDEFTMTRQNAIMPDSSLNTAAANSSTIAVNSFVPTTDSEPRTEVPVTTAGEDSEEREDVPANSDENVTSYPLVPPTSTLQRVNVYPAPQQPPRNLRIPDLNNVNLFGITEPIVVEANNTYGDADMLGAVFEDLPADISNAFRNVQDHIRQDGQYIQGMPPVHIYADNSIEGVRVTMPSGRVFELPLTGTLDNMTLIAQRIAAAVLERLAEYY